MGPERSIRSGDAQICTQAFGADGDPAVLLIMGQMASMLWWPEAFCERLSATGRFVIRYDHRDTGRSTAYPPGQPPYTSDDMIADAVAVLDGYGVERAHLVGVSMGGALAQMVALRHLDRVASLTAISTSNAVDSGAGLPGPSAEYMRHAAAFASLDWSDAAAVADLIVADVRALSGARPFDEGATREFVERDLARTANPASLANHERVRGGDAALPPLAELDMPVLVIHGDADPLLPHEHGVALARAIPGARLLTLEGGGHGLHEVDWDQAIAAIRKLSGAAPPRPPR